MKTNITIQYFILLLLFNISYHSIIAQGLVTTDNQWNIAVYPTFSPNTSTYSLRIGEDTTVNNIVYQKVYHSNDDQLADWTFNNSLLREDAAEKKVYVKDGNGSEHLLYDFSLEVNDTFHIEGSCTLIVNEIDSVSLNNSVVRKRMKLEIKDSPINEEQYWIEGIGSEFGLLSHFLFCGTDYADGLLCFYSNSELLYPSAPSSCFITPTKNLIRSNVKISPNPVLSSLSIDDPESILEQYSIYNTTGQLMKRGNLIRSKNNIDLSSLLPGFYIITFEDDTGNYYSQKIIKN